MEITKGTFRVTVTERYSNPEGVSTRAGAAVFAMEHGLIHRAPVT
jgi:hypothetical protein